MCICDEYPDLLPRTSMDDMIQLKANVVEIRTDYRHWKTWYLCTRCGQHWLEQYTPAGHADIPELLKVSGGN